MGLSPRAETTQRGCSRPEGCFQVLYASENDVAIAVTASRAGLVQGFCVRQRAAVHVPHTAQLFGAKRRGGIDNHGMAERDPRCGRASWRRAGAGPHPLRMTAWPCSLHLGADRD